VSNAPEEAPGRPVRVPSSEGAERPVRSRGQGERNGGVTPR
jgi:hypothetical protein